MAQGTDRVGPRGFPRRQNVMAAAAIRPASALCPCTGTARSDFQTHPGRPGARQISQPGRL